MMRNCIYWTILLVTLLTACGGDSSEPEEELDLAMPVYLSVAADGMQSRSPGDPGVGDNQQLPRYLYVLFVERLLDLDGKITTEFVVDRMQERLDDSKWVYKADKKCYYYNGPLMMYLTHKDIAETGAATDKLGDSRVYAITSYSPVNFEWATTKEQVENLQLSIAAGQQTSDFDLQNVYATPFADPENGKVTKRAKFLYQTEVTCHHVASRVDIQWDINPAQHDKHWLKEVKVPKVPTVGYFFKPTTPVTNASVKPYSFKTNAGNQWYGRCVFHVIDKNPLMCVYVLNTGNQKGQPHSPNGVTAGYANWYRINATFGY